jgi:predicted RNA-binding protein with PUA-like domain
METPARIWLMKSEPNVFSIYDLQSVGKSPWDGVRNYQARNFMRDAMCVGDLVLFYHSNAKPPGVAGIARVCREAYPDFTAFEKNHEGFDPKSNPKKPRWFMVDVEIVEIFPYFVPLETLRLTKGLETLWVIRKGMRLSVQPVEKKHFETIKKLGHTCTHELPP